MKRFATNSSSCWRTMVLCASTERELGNDARPGLADRPGETPTVTCKSISDTKVASAPRDSSFRSCVTQAERQLARSVHERAPFLIEERTCGLWPGSGKPGAATGSEEAPR